MSLIDMPIRRTSVFTFESTGHSSHVLRHLNEQRCLDLLCDVTVLVEGRSFRAHRSVLASCCDYFAQRISSLTQQGAFISLPPEVTAAGFEPLLQFAYTSELRFEKNNVLDVQHAASVLGFRDLDESCFDFLLPKFFPSYTGTFPLRRKNCCKKSFNRKSLKDYYVPELDDVLLDDKKVEPIADSSSQQEVNWDNNKSVNNKMGKQSSTSAVVAVAGEMNDAFMQCPKYRKFQLACGKEICAPPKSAASSGASATASSCARPCQPGSGSIETLVEFPKYFTSKKIQAAKKPAEELQKAETQLAKADDPEKGSGVNPLSKNASEGEMQDEVMKKTVSMVEEQKANSSTVDSSETNMDKTGQAGSAELTQHHCSQTSFHSVLAITREPRQDTFGNDSNEFKEEMDEPETVSTHQNTQVESKEKRSDNACVNGPTDPMDPKVMTKMEEDSEQYPSPLKNPTLNLQNPEEGCSTNFGGGKVQKQCSEYPKLCPNFNPTEACPFLQEPSGAAAWDEASPSGVSSVNSGDDCDSETETEGDSESSTVDRDRQVNLPFSVDLIEDLSRNDFQLLLKQHVFTQDQLDAVHDMRRRSKNRLAAQRCRKRKLDCIHNLQCEIVKLKTEREKLIMEKSQLSQMKLKTCQSFKKLCQKVCNKANLQPEQMEVLTKYYSSDCILSLQSLSVQPHASLTPSCGGQGTSKEGGDTPTRQHIP